MKKLKNKLNQKIKPWKKSINLIRIFKKLTGLVRFRFHNPETKKPNWTEINKKPNRKNQAKPKSNPLEITKKTQKNNIVFCF